MALARGSRLPSMRAGFVRLAVRICNVVWRQHGQAARPLLQFRLGQRTNRTRQDRAGEPYRTAYQYSTFLFAWDERRRGIASGPAVKLSAWTSLPSFKKYTGEINVRIGWFWDSGIEVRLGDEMNGYLAEENLRTVDEIVPWLQDAIAHFYPNSTYAASLDPELRSRAAIRLFLASKVGATAICPHCGAPKASMMEMRTSRLCLPTLR